MVHQIGRQGTTALRLWCWFEFYSFYVLPLFEPVSLFFKWEEKLFSVSIWEHTTSQCCPVVKCSTNISFLFCYHIVRFWCIQTWPSWLSLASAFNWLNDWTNKAYDIISIVCRSTIIVWYHCLVRDTYLSLPNKHPGSQESTIRICIKP